MAKRRKGQVRKGHGATCNLCGKNCGTGGGLKKHVEGSRHVLDYEDYRRSFYPKRGKVISDVWNSVSNEKGVPVLLHVLVRRFVGDPGPRGSPNKRGAGR
jgi:hypothetical protein